MQRVEKIIKTIEPHDSIKRYTELGVDVIEGEAKIVSPWEVQVKTNGEQRTITTRSIVIAAGSHPFVPPISGLEAIDYLTSDTIWNIKTLPERLVVLGGGPIGCELAQCFARFGSQVTLVEMLPGLLDREDTEVSEIVMARFKEEGIDCYLEHKATQFVRKNGEKVLIAEHQGEQIKIPFDEVLIAIGRTANIKGYGIEEMGITVSPRKTIETNAFQETNYSNIYACGDVSGPYQFTHTAAHQAWYAVVNALFGQFKRFRVDYSVIPWSTFIDPEVARVGLNEKDALQQEIAYEVTRYDLDDLDRAITGSVAYGFVKVLTVPGKDRILGVTIVGEHAGDLIAEFVLAIRHGIGLNKILDTIHIYPTMAESSKYVAGVWKRKHAPTTILSLLARYHAWLRGEQIRKQ